MNVRGLATFTIVHPKILLLVKIICGSVCFPKVLSVRLFLFLLTSLFLSHSYFVVGLVELFVVLFPKFI